MQDIDDADTLFLKYTIPQLRALQLKLVSDIDRKKQDLRIMVGERYRDVILAGDSITSMKKLGESTTESFKNLILLCKVESVKGQRMPDQESNSVYPVAAQIKLLVDTPEQIWKGLESHEYLKAARLYLVARLIYKNLQTSKQGLEVQLKVNKK